MKLIRLGSNHRNRYQTNKRVVLNLLCMTSLNGKLEHYSDIYYTESKESIYGNGFPALVAFAASD